MKKSLIIALTILFAAGAAFAQKKLTAEQEVTNLYYQYQQAAIAGDLVFMQNILAEDHISIGPNGEVRNRTETLEGMKSFILKPTIKFISLDHADVRVRVSANMAVVTADWKLKAKPIWADEKVEPMIDTGMITLVFEKRTDKWLVTVEHVSFRPRRVSMPNQPK
jgi:ketosteroid isomerase-like protein